LASVATLLSLLALAAPLWAAEVDLNSATQEELVALRELVAIGDILALQERAAQLEQRDPQWRAFARELARLTGQFELEKLRALLNEYLPTEPSSG